MASPSPTDGGGPIPAGSLAGIRVLDLSRILAGPYCTQILADHGASVIKVEPPQGDDTRGWGPPFSDGTASYFLGLNRNKRGIVLDLSTPSGREVLERLLGRSDVLVENFKAGTLEAWGLGDSAAIGRRFPQLVHCRISGFGEDGPLGGLPGYDAVAQAMTGLMAINGSADSGPLRLGTPAVDIATGLNAAIGILMALHERHLSGRGQFVQATLYDTGLSLLHPHLANFHLNGREPQRTGNAHPNIAPYDCFATLTAPIFLGVGNDRQFAVLCEVLARLDLAADPRFATNASRNAHRADLRTELERSFAKADGEGLSAELMERGVPCGPVFGLEAATSHPHTRHRSMVVDIDDYRGTGSPIVLSRTPATYRTPPPKLDEHREAVLSELMEVEQKPLQP